MVGLIGLALAVAAAKLDEPWLTFSRAPAFDRRVTIVEAGTFTAGPAQWNYWFRRTVRKGRSAQVWWTDTTRCPAARWVVVEAVNLQPPRIEMPGVKIKDDVIISGDGVDYSFSSEASFDDGVLADIHFTSNVGTPLAAWADESLRRLEPCWSREPPSGN